MEYLAPGVYLEEVPSGNKPIEGVSTSTAGMVGVTQRGPVNSPTLVTSFGEFSRVFGGLLDHRIFTNQRDALPYAAQGFFANSGQRLFVVRVVGDNASFAASDIYGEPPTDRATTTLAARAAAGTSTLTLADANNIADGDQLVIVDNADPSRSVYVAVVGAAAVTGIFLGAVLQTAVAAGTVVTPGTVAVGEALETAGDMEAGGGLNLIDAVIAGLAADEVLRLSDTANPNLTEYVRISADGDQGIFENGLLFDHPAATTEVHRVELAAGAATTAAQAAVGSRYLDLASLVDFAPGGAAQVGNRLFAVAGIASEIPLEEPLAFTYGAGLTVIKQIPLLRVYARYPGLWGNALRVRIGAANILDTILSAAAAAGDSRVTLGAVFGLASGSHLQIASAAGTEVIRVVSVNLATNEVILAAPLAQAAAVGVRVTSQEFNLIVERLENGRVSEAEVFENLGVHPEHNRYAPRIVGSFDRATLRSSDSGESNLVRLADLTFNEAGEVIAEQLPNRASLPSPAVPRPLAAGDDDLANLDEQSYIGIDSDDPATRTGIHSLRNEEAISIVAVPGRTEVALQKTLTEHCEIMRYRFAVLETPRNSTMRDAITHRQNFDTTRAAIYYPWLVVPDLFGERGDLLRIPPAGHVMGIYARTDTTRGVWKAPANEVVRGILAFDSVVTKGEQDLLNPVHVNAFRDFRTANRGLRLWGARTLSSDPEMKYINVRRLMLFLEQSLDAGLQYAVFEPNSEVLWATVKQSITGFLDGVWRSGALEGTKQEEAFFVSVGYNVTMTQSDIDNGRLVVVIGVAPVKPAEFVIVRISQKTREATA